MPIPSGRNAALYGFPLVLGALFLAACSSGSAPRRDHSAPVSPEPANIVESAARLAGPSGSVSELSQPALQSSPAKRLPTGSSIRHHHRSSAGGRPASSAPEPPPDEPAAPVPARSGGEAAARAALDHLALEPGFLHWPAHLDMKQGAQTPVTIEVGRSARSTLGSQLEALSIEVQTSPVMTAELHGSDTDLSISPQGEVEQGLIDGGAKWTWYVTPAGWGARRLYVTLRMSLRLPDGRNVSHSLPASEVPIDVSISPVYLVKTHWALLFGTGGTGGLIGTALKNRRLRRMLAQVFGGEKTTGA